MFISFFLNLFLSNNKTEREDQFKLNVGNLPPQTECVISIKYATVIRNEGDALMVTVPITKVALRERELQFFQNGDALR
jgi:hypothetical protein